jgi:hypothetical protein
VASAASVAVADAPDRREIERGLAPAAISLLALSLVTEYRVRVSASAEVPELACYVAIVALLFVRSNAPPSAAARRLWVAFALLTVALVGRALYIRLFRLPAGESPFSRVRDAEVPLVMVLLVLSRVRLGPRALRTVETAVLLSGVVMGVLGILQFFNGGPYLFEGIDNTLYKTRYAQSYYIARLFHLEVKQIARGLHYFSIDYAFSLIVPCVVAFCVALRGRGRRRWWAFAACGVIYFGLYLSFARSVIAVMPTVWVMAGLAMYGRLRPWMCVAMVAGYIAAAFVAPMFHVALLGDDNLGTLTARYDSLLSYVRETRRDPSIFIAGGTVASWKEWEWESIVPHNWIVNSALTDGIPATALRIGSYLALLVALWPVRRGRRTVPLAAGLWCGSFVLLVIVGESEPLAGISPYLSAAVPLAALATIDRERMLEPVEEQLTVVTTAADDQ